MKLIKKNYKRKKNLNRILHLPQLRTEFRVLSVLQDCFHCLHVLDNILRCLSAFQSKSPSLSPTLPDSTWFQLTEIQANEKILPIVTRPLILL